VEGGSNYLSDHASGTDSTQVAIRLFARRQGLFPIRLTGRQARDSINSWEIHISIGFVLNNAPCDSPATGWAREGNGVRNDVRIVCLLDQVETRVGARKNEREVCSPLNASETEA